MARTYREIAIEDMLGTVQEAMSQVVDWWGDLPPPMKEAIEQFRTQLGAAIDSVEFVKRALDRQVHETGPKADIATYSITSSASNCIELGTVSPSVLAVPRLMTNSNLVGCSTGMSPGFSPLRIRAT